MFDFILEVGADALFDCVRMIPFLFIAFLILESIERCSDSTLTRLLSHRRANPLIGAILGCVPQCGFSALISGLYCGGAVTAGTLIAVFLSTSDEALLILLSQPGETGTVFKLLAVKLVVAILAGYLTDAIAGLRGHSQKHVEDLCDHCGCHNHRGIIIPALNHTARLFAFLFVFTLLLDLMIEGAGMDVLSGIFLDGTVFQPFLTAMIGMIPSCASSIFITRMFLDGVISFGSAVSGLCAGAGMGIVILFKTNRHLRENLLIAAVLYGFSVAAGLLFCLL